MPADPRPHPWRPFQAAALALPLTCGFLLASAGPEEGLRAVIRFTARSSLALFLLAYTASALARLRAGGPLAWPRRHRRQLGLAFALSHGLHLVAIVALARLYPETFRAASRGSPVPGAVAYAFILAMAATSFDRTAGWIGPRAWRLLHGLGAFYVWVSFAIAFAKRAPGAPLYWVPVGLLAAAMGLRLAGRRGAAPASARGAA